MRIAGFRGLSFGTVMRHAVKDFVEDDLMTYAAALAFHVLFAIFPFLVFLVALLGLLQLSDFFEWLLQQAQYVLPPQAMEQVEQVIFGFYVANFADYSATLRQPGHRGRATLLLPQLSSAALQCGSERGH